MSRFQILGGIIGNLLKNDPTSRLSSQQISRLARQEVSRGGRPPHSQALRHPVNKPGRCADI
jgi:hypothetical protein